MHGLLSSWLSQVLDKNGFPVRKCQRWVQYINDMIKCIYTNMGRISAYIVLVYFKRVMKYDENSVLYQNIFKKQYFHNMCYVKLLRGLFVRFTLAER